MKHGEIVKEMMLHRGYSQRRLARETGTQTCSITNVLHKENTTLKTMTRICKVLGYEIVFRPKNYVRAMEGEMILDES